MWNSDWNQLIYSQRHAGNAIENIGIHSGGVKIKKIHQVAKLYYYEKRDLDIHLCNFNNAFPAGKLRKFQLFYLTAWKHSKSWVQNHPPVIRLKVRTEPRKTDENLTEIAKAFLLTRLWTTKTKANSYLHLIIVELNISLEIKRRIYIRACKIWGPVI